MLNDENILLVMVDTLYKNQQMYLQYIKMIHYIHL